MPEFLNRIDSMIVFNSLTPEVVYKLIDKFLGEYYENQHDDATIILATDQLKDWIVSQVVIRKAGRELKRVINKNIISPAAEVKIKMPKGVPLIADVSQDDPKRVIFWVSKRMVNSVSKLNS
jgi:ATP-dependent Clp protease ATP-binding subunit ClpA